jgi:sulfur carrier protein
MKLIINGKDCIEQENILLSTLIKKSDLNPKNIIVQVDQEIIKKDLFTTLTLQENSVIEILAIVGGG